MSTRHRMRMAAPPQWIRQAGSRCAGRRGTGYFRVHLEQDLWAGWLVTQVNSRRGSRWGPTRDPLPSIEVALLTLAANAKRRRQRGY